MPNPDVTPQKSPLTLIELVAKLRAHHPELHRELIHCVNHDPSPLAQSIYHRLKTANLLPYTQLAHHH